jgi:hypothetical protein
MALPDPERLQGLIAWQFTVADQNQVSRYGTYDGAFWKQYLPQGAPFPSLHPPKKILQALYERAKTQATAQP